MNNQAARWIKGQVINTFQLCYRAFKADERVLKISFLKSVTKDKKKLLNKQHYFYQNNYLKEIMLQQPLRIQQKFPCLPFLIKHF